MKFTKILAGIAIVMMISGTALANNSIQSRHGGDNGGGNSWGQGTSGIATSAPSSIPNAHGRGKPSESSNNSIQSRHGGDNGGGNSWGQGTSGIATSGPSSIPNAHGKGKPSN